MERVAVENSDVRVKAFLLLPMAINTSLCGLFMRLPLYPLSYLRICVRLSLLSDKLRYQQSNIVDGSVIVQISSLPAIVDAYDADEAVANYVSIAIFMFFGCSTDASVAAVALG